MSLKPSHREFSAIYGTGEDRVEHMYIPRNSENEWCPTTHDMTHFIGHSSAVCTVYMEKTV